MSSSPVNMADVMLRPEAYPHPVDGPVHVQTHISHIFLTGQYAYKLKKPVNLGFLDFSTREARLFFCQEELRLNRRLAPHVYLGLSALEQRGGSWRLVPMEQAKAPEKAEPVLRMAQMDPGRMMDRLMAQGLVSLDMARAIARVLAAFYARAERGPQVDFFGRPRQIELNAMENFEQTAGYRGVSVSEGRWRHIKSYTLGFLENEKGLFEQRVERGFIVDGHGDLHSGNINLPEGKGPIIFDCIEFNQRFRYQDAACDLAFLAMDLDFAGRSDLSQALAEEYMLRSGDRGLAEALNFYKCYRAVVRAKIYGFELDDESVPAAQKFTDLNKARAYFRLAAGYAGAEPPFFLVLFMGLMGVGKSFLAKKLAGAAGWPHIQSDVVRKQNAGLSPTDPRPEGWGRGIYGEQATDAVYRAMAKGAEASLAQGQSVVVDASFRGQAQREIFLGLAGKHGARPLLVWVTADEKAVKRRLAARRAKGKSASDGRLELMAAQKAAWQDFSGRALEHLFQVDGGASERVKMGKLMAKLAEMGHVH